LVKSDLAVADRHPPSHIFLINPPNKPLQMSIPTHLSKDDATAATAETAAPAASAINYGNLNCNEHVHIGPVIHNYASSANELTNNQGGSTQIQSVSPLQWIKQKNQHQNCSNHNRTSINSTK
jgi:hypothetical protein